MEYKPVLYECDKKACKDCGPDCHLTTDVAHAKNFRVECAGTYIEQEKEKTFTNKMIIVAMELVIVAGVLALGFKFVTWLLM